MKRVLTAAVLAPLICWVVLGSASLPFTIALNLVAFFCYLEYVQLTRLWPSLPAVIGYAAGMALLWIPSFDPAILVATGLIVLALSLRAESMAAVLPLAAAVLFGVLYCFGPWRCAEAIRSLSPAGPYLLLYALALNWIGDMAAFYVGSRWGKRKLAPRISPGKSWEGSIGSVTASVLFGVVFLNYFVPGLALGEVAAVSVAANIAGQLGDLCESALKRGVGVKDSGTLLPGHGGWLDRVDSSLFALPVVYFWAVRLFPRLPI
jgi:phosphatidate cytidylyltransferase